jgi:hypothetical protein
MSLFGAVYGLGLVIAISGQCGILHFRLSIILSVTLFLRTLEKGINLKG